MRQQISSDRRTGMPITAALEGRRGDRSTPEERLTEHLGSIRTIRSRAGGFGVRGQIEGKIGRQAYGRLLDQLASRTRKPRRRRGGRRPS